jgi:hypothetical protein
MRRRRAHLVSIPDLMVVTAEECWQRTTPCAQCNSSFFALGAVLGPSQANVSRGLSLPAEFIKIVSLRAPFGTSSVSADEILDGIRPPL